MGFMIPTAEYFAAYHVDTNAGIEIVPEEVCGGLSVADEIEPDPCAVLPADAAALRDYLEGSNISSIERKQGWYARLSAPGYLDCTSWDGPYATAEEALAAIKELYECDDDGDTSSDDTGETVRP